MLCNAKRWATVKIQKLNSGFEVLTAVKMMMFF
jgi:hypothetical protein